jgi:cytochrome P450
MNPSPDPFREKRQSDGVLKCPFHGEPITMILRHEDVRKAAKDWKTFSSDAPFRVPIPSEEGVRTMRQLPIETNPPEHGDYREIVEPFFRRPKTPEMIAKVEALIDELLSDAMQRDSVDVVGHFALHLQSRALTYLLDVPESEADTWIGWGTHVFKVGEGTAKGAALEAYLHAQFDKAAAAPGSRAVATRSSTPSPRSSPTSAAIRRRWNSFARIRRASSTRARSSSAHSCRSRKSAASARRTPTSSGPR